MYVSQLVSLTAAQFIRSHTFYYKSPKTPHQVLQVMCAASERAMKLKVCMIKLLPL